MDYWCSKEKQSNISREEAAGNVADSMGVRMAIMARIQTGEITLEQGQAELAKIKRTAKKNGQITRAQAYRRG